MAPDEEFEAPRSPSRARRAKALGAASLVVIAIACAAYLHPAAGAHNAQPVAAPSAAGAGYQLDAVDFVTPSTGWVLADLVTPEFAVLSTIDAGRHWTQRLIAHSPRHGEYMRFFDRSNGVVVTAGPNPSLFQTRNGGAAWIQRRLDALDPMDAISASFVDIDHGWVLAHASDSTPHGSTSLFTTSDGGAGWINLGQPVVAPDQAFGVNFADVRRGWLDTVASGPYAYATADSGRTWQRVPLPAPRTGWPAPHGAFFVAATPTKGSGVVAIVVNAAPDGLNGRVDAGTTFQGYPPLTVGTYDGGSPVVLIYSTLLDSNFDGIVHVWDAVLKPGRGSQVQPADQFGITSIDGGSTWRAFAPPAAGGTVGYSDELDWWWVAPGARSTSADAGLTWAPDQTSSVADPLPGSLQVLDASHAWVGVVTDIGPVLYTTLDGGAHWTKVSLPVITPTQASKPATNP